MARSDARLDDVDFTELESVDQYGATFTGTLEGDEVSVTYALRKRDRRRRSAGVYPGDDELENVLIRPETYEFETGTRDTVRFTGTDAGGQTLFLIYVFTEAEATEENEVGLSVNPNV